MRNYNGPIYLLIIFSLLATLLMWGNMISIYTGVVFNLFTILGIVAFDFMKTRRITLFQIWGVAFVYIIWAEMMNMSVLPSASRYLNAITFLFVSKSVLDIGYMTYHPKRYTNHLREAWLLVKPKAFFVVMVVMLVVWLSSNYLTVMATMNSGRQLGDVLGNSINVGGGIYLSFESYGVCAGSILLSLAFKEQHTLESSVLAARNDVSDNSWNPRSPYLYDSSLANLDRCSKCKASENENSLVGDGRCHSPVYGIKFYEEISESGILRTQWRYDYCNRGKADGSLPPSCRQDESRGVCLYDLPCRGLVLNS